MTDPGTPPPPPEPDSATVPEAQAVDLADGDWHRLHPATPLLRGGIAVVAVIGIIIANLRERIIDLVFGVRGYEGDPIDYIVERGLVGVVLLAGLVVLLLCVAGFWLSWRMHTFRITDELVEVRSGILFRTHRKARLDRIQGINIARPLFARIFGAARLEVNQAGQDANVHLAYLGSRVSDALRAEILRLASGSREERPAHAPAAPGAAGVVAQRLEEFIAPELDPSAQPTSVVSMHPGRLVGSTVLNFAFVAIVVVVIGGIVAATVSGEPAALFGVVPFVIGLGSFLVNRVMKSLRYTIAATPDGVRVGFGLLSTSNETLPPGRVHSLQIVQPLLWRPADWWEVRVNRASHSSARGAAGQANTTILPVGTREDVFKVVELVLPGLVDDATRALVHAGLERAHAGDGYTTSPRRAAVLRWFSWRRNGYALLPEAVVLRRGAVWRDLVIAPTPRMQSVAVHQGPLLRALRLAAIRVHTVAGPITASLGALDADDAGRFFRDVAEAGVEAARSDRSHRWRSGESLRAGDAAT